MTECGGWVSLCTCVHLYIRVHMCLWGWQMHKYQSSAFLEGSNKSVQNIGTFWCHFECWYANHEWHETQIPTVPEWKQVIVQKYKLLIIFVVSNGNTNNCPNLCTWRNDKVVLVDNVLPRDPPLLFLLVHEVINQTTFRRQHPEKHKLVVVSCGYSDYNAGESGLIPIMVGFFSRLLSGPQAHPALMGTCLTILVKAV